MSYHYTYLSSDFIYFMDNPRKSFSKIYDQHINKIYRFIFIKVSSQEIAQDLCSETFLRGWEAFKKSQNPGNIQKIENPSAFLYKIARNLIIDHYREKGRFQTVSAEYSWIADPKVNLEETSFINSDLDRIRMALADIKDDYREVIVWHYLDDLKVPEIAQILEKPEGTIRVLLHRALTALRTNVNNGVKEV